MGKGVLRTWPQTGSWTEIQLIGANGQQRWSSNDKIWRAPSILQGTKSYSQRTTPVYGTTTTAIGSCNANATWVLGYVKLSAITLQPGQLSPFPAVGDWYHTSGTILGFAGVGDAICTYTFTASGGTVYLTEDLAIYEIKNEFGQTFPYPAFTLAYDIEIGQFPT